ncbi:nucleotidyl transferase AbiEii/AbiGii toxin family protein [soil metagenome]
MLGQDFSEFVGLLNSHNVRYLVVGGYAVAFHGHPRFTGDIDIWVDRTEDNARRLVSALEEFGFGSVGLSAEVFVTADQVVQLGYPPNRIDILTDLTGVTFGPCFETKQTATFGATEVHFIGLESLKFNKRALGRYQDLADLENLHECGSIR